jgi:gamma-glutamyltranspeptidase/glutathione hydrolase
MEKFASFALKTGAQSVNAVSGNCSLAVETAADIMRLGGNAFDACAAAGLALQVVEPHQCGLGGEVVALLQSAGRDRPSVLCGQGTAPTGATLERYRREGLTTIPGQGLMAAVVPGAFDAWMILLREFGTMRLREVMAPALRFAHDGFAINDRASLAISRSERMFRTKWPSSAAVFLSNGRAPAPGERLENRALAATYQRILKEAEQSSSSREAQIEAARNGFYRGFVAEEIDRFVRSNPDIDDSGDARTGCLCANDLADWTATFEEPLEFAFDGFSVYKPGPWAQGPAMLQVLALLADVDIGHDGSYGPEFIHLFVEASKLGYADREAWYGDPRFVNVPITTLLSEAYTAERRRLIQNSANNELRPGCPDGIVPRMPHLPDQASSSTSAPRQTTASAEPVGGNTSQINVLDRFGNMISASSSGGWLTGSPIIASLGFALSTRGQMFWLQESLASSLAPGKRPRTTLSPTLVGKDGVPVAAFGCRGADKADQWNAQFLVHRIRHRMSVEASLRAPHFYSAHWPTSTAPRRAYLGRLHISDAIDDRAATFLTDRGHVVDRRTFKKDSPLDSDYCVCVVARDEDGVLAAVAPTDPGAGALLDS